MIKNRGFNMKTIAMISSKGGAGKTTLAIHLALAASAAGHQAVIADLDPLENAVAWRNGAPAAADLPTVLPIRPVPETWDENSVLRTPSRQQKTAAAIAKVIDEAKLQKAEFLVLDTPTRDPVIVTLAAKTADVVLIPSRVGSEHDLEELELTLSLVRDSRKPAYVIPNAVSAISGFTADASNRLSATGAWVAPHYLMNRAAFAGGRDIDWARLASHDAGREIEALYRWLCDVLGMPPRREAQKVA